MNYLFGPRLDNVGEVPEQVGWVVLSEQSRIASMNLSLILRLDTVEVVPRVEHHCISCPGGFIPPIRG